VREILTAPKKNIPHRPSQSIKGCHQTFCKDPNNHSSTNAKRNLYHLLCCKTIPPAPHEAEFKPLEKIMNANKEDSKDFMERQSRYQDWQELKALKDFKNYRRPKSNPGMWKNPQGHYRRAPDRTPSTPKRRRMSSSSGWSDTDEDTETLREIEKN
jgi:hypothetical protein